MSASDTGLSASSSSASWRVQAARKGPSNAIASLDDSDEEDTTEPERPSTEEEEQDFVLFMAKQGELPEDEEDEEEEHGIPQVLNEEQIVNDLLSATGNGEVDESTYGQENKFLGIDDVSLLPSSITTDLEARSCFTPFQGARRCRKGSRARARRGARPPPGAARELQHGRGSWATAVCC